MSSKFLIHIVSVFDDDPELTNVPVLAITALTWCIGGMTKYIVRGDPEQHFFVRENDVATDRDIYFYGQTNGETKSRFDLTYKRTFNDDDHMDQIVPELLAAIKSKFN